MHVLDPRFTDFDPLPRRDEWDDGMVKNRHVILSVRGHKHPEAGARNIVTDRVPKPFQDRHQVVPSNEARMDQEQSRPLFRHLMVR